jgi:alcohol dehydrogenase
VVEWCDVPEPTIVEPTDALVRPIAVARCEIDPLLILAGPRRAARFAVGHEAVAEVVAVGDNIDLAVGTRVLPSFQVSCGSCAQCRRGKSAICASYPILSDYGMEPLSGVEYGGMVSDLVRVPHAATMLTTLPERLDPVALASVPDNVLDGYRSVATHLAARGATDVLIACHGNPSIGLYAAQAAAALGAGSVTLAAADPGVLKLAAEVGADTLDTDFQDRPTRTWPLVVDCGVRPAGLQWAIRATEPEGVLHSVSGYIDEPTSLPLLRLYTLGIEFHIGRAHSAALLPEVIGLVADGRLRPELVTTQVIDWDEAPEHYLDPTIKLVVSRSPRAAR